MLEPNIFLETFLDTLTGHLALAFFLLAVTDEGNIWRQLKKLPLLILSPFLVVLLSYGLSAVPELRMAHYFILSVFTLILCTLWVRWAWQLGFWSAFAATCMASIFQVTMTALSATLFLGSSLDERFQFVSAVGLHLGLSIIATLLLYKLSFGKYFRLLLDNEPVPQRFALLLFALEAAMEVFFFLAGSIETQYLVFYYLLVVVMVVLIAALVVYMAERFDVTRKMQAQQDIIAQQRLYEQDLETIRREVRAFRHDYKNLLAGLSQQAGSGELDELRRTLSELEAGFDQRLGRKIQTSTQIGNLQIPEVRSLFLSKLSAMLEKRIECRLEILYPVTVVEMDVWDFVRCAGILIDNAMEAALDADPSWVEIVLLAQEGWVFFRISNSYANSIAPERMWSEGCSTKGAGRGLGLSNYQHILENYPNASHFTSWKNSIFVQELTVEGRL